MENITSMVERRRAKMKMSWSLINLWSDALLPFATEEKKSLGWLIKWLVLSLCSWLIAVQVVILLLLLFKITVWAGVEQKYNRNRVKLNSTECHDYSLKTKTNWGVMVRGETEKDDCGNWSGMATLPGWYGCGKDSKYCQAVSPLWLGDVSWNIVLVFFCTCQKIKKKKWR